MERFSFAQILTLVMLIVIFPRVYSNFDMFIEETKRSIIHQHENLVNNLDKKNVLARDEVTVEAFSDWRDSKVQKRSAVTENVGDTPNTIQISIPMPGRRSEKLRLQKNNNVNMNAQVVFRENGVEIPLNGHNTKNAAVYQDSNNWAAITVWTINMPSNSQKIHSQYFVGSFVSQGKEYLIAPNISNSSSTGRSKLSVSHFIYKRRDMPPGHDEEEIYEKIKKRSRGDLNIAGQGLGPNAFSRGMLKIELRMLIDVSIYTYWMKRTNNNVIEATKQIKYIFSHIANGADLVYRRIKLINIGIYLLDYEILTTAADSKMTVGNTAKGVSWLAKDFTKVAIDGDRVLTDLTAWMMKNERRRRADHITIMTLLNMPDAVGLAPMSEGCRSEPVSIIEATNLNSWDTLAHEIGHNFGCDHDGSNGCPANDKYIMTPSGDVFEATNIKNGYRFSSCSERDIKNYIQILKSENKLCLNKIEHGRHNEPYKFVKLLPGLKYTLDDQCGFQIAGSKFCDLKEDICVALFCSVGNSEDCKGGGGLRAASGTPCGNKKWCKLGSCVYDPNAPQISGNYVDFKGIKVSSADPKLKVSRPGSSSPNSGDASPNTKIYDSGTDSGTYDDSDTDSDTYDDSGSGVGAYDDSSTDTGTYSDGEESAVPYDSYNTDGLYNDNSYADVGA